jgi:hypothetical protein
MLFMQTKPRLFSKNTKNIAQKPNKKLVIA